ncbi:MAG: hypothetical protein ACTSV2_01545 [Candidatus Thorarchaeota archaeon]
MKDVRGNLHILSTKLKENIGLLSILIINLLLRMPRVSGILGDDAFVALWMGLTISSGDISAWTITILSPFGLFPFASYPVGVPLLIAFMFEIGLSYESSVLALTLIFSGLSVLGSYALGKELFPDKNIALFFAAAYSLSGIFMRFTYFTISPRGPFLALLPWFLFFAVKFARSRQPRDALGASLFLLLLFLTHGLAILIPLYFATWLGYLILRHGSKFLNATLLKTTDLGEILGIRIQKIMMWGLFIGLSVIGFFTGLSIFGLDTGKTTAFLMSNDSTIGIMVNLMVDYGLRLGILSVLLPIGIILAFRRDYDTNRRWVHLTLVPIVVFTIPKSLYASVLFLPVLIYYSVYGFEVLWKSDNRFSFVTGLLAFGVLYGFAYHMVVVSLTPFAIALTICSGIGLVFLVIHRILTTWNIIRPRITSTHLWSLVIIVMVSFTIVTTDGLIEQNETSYIGEDENNIISYLLALEESGLIFTYDDTIARRLQAYGLIAINSHNDQIGLQAGWITPQEILDETPMEFNLTTFLRTGDIFHYEGNNPEDEMWNHLFPLDLTNVTELEMSVSYGLRYVVVENLGSSYGSTAYLTAGISYCPLLASTPSVGELVLEGESMVLFRIFI